MYCVYEYNSVDKNSLPKLKRSKYHLTHFYALVTK